MRQFITDTQVALMDDSQILEEVRSFVACGARHIDACIVVATSYRSNRPLDYVYHLTVENEEIMALEELLK